MGDSETGQVSNEAAKIYEAVYLPALFQEWCPVAIQAACIKNGDTVLDVACGTGALAISVASRVGAEGRSVGIDINNGMLTIARTKSSSVEWIHAPAEKLPFEDDSFDSVVSQFGLMYFEKQTEAIREMARVLRPGGRIAISVWDKLDNNPGLAAEEYLWQRVFDEAVDEAPYRLGDKSILNKLFEGSGLNGIQVDTLEGTGRFESIESWIHTGAMGWTEDDSLSDDELRLLLETAKKELTEFQTERGTVVFPTSAHIITATK